jgi:hypothetical protein
MSNQEQQAQTTLTIAPGLANKARVRYTATLAYTPRPVTAAADDGANAFSKLTNMSRPPSTASTATTTTSNGHARTMSVKTTTKPQTLNPIPAPDIRLFVTNLRLLDFDVRQDWPDITVQTFSAKNADQRQRISGTEWALFRLFETWDANETAQV